MSLNWKEINLALSELELTGSQIQKVFQTNYDVLAFQARTRSHITRLVLIVLSPGACRIHETFRAAPKNEKPLRFAEFLKARLVNSWIEEAVQLGDNRIIRLRIRRGETNWLLYLRLWSNAANVILTDNEGVILDAMKRLPRRGEIKGGRYTPEASLAPETGAGGGRAPKNYEVRDLPGTGSFCEKIDALYAENSGRLSLESLQEELRRFTAGSSARLEASLSRLREKEADYTRSDRLRTYGDIIMAKLGEGVPGASWLETEDFSGEKITIELDSRLSLVENAEAYYDRYRRAKSGLGEIREEISRGEAELEKLAETEERLLEETNPLILEKQLGKLRRGESGGISGAERDRAKKRPGLSFADGEWLILVGRDARENDEILRHHVKGNDLWLHVRDYAGSYVFIRYRAGKTVPLETLLDAGNLALFYSKGRNNGSGNLYYTQVKYLRRAKNGPRGLVIPTQEKNILVELDQKRLKRLEGAKIQ